MSSNELESHITKKYAVRKRLGKGAYGIVWKAVDKKTLEVVALKKIFDAFRNATDAQRTFREIIFLQAFVNHRNIIRLRNVIRAENDKDIYLVFEFMDTDLHNVIKKGSILTEVHKQFIMYQLLAATKYIHSGNVIHRDYKPSNILLDEQCIVKVCDFGLARSLSQITVDDHGDPNLTEYVATRWYRAPEILLACHKYTKGVDMWSLGCILGEMLTEKPLFPGSSTLDQIEKIIASVDPPTKEDISNMQSTYGPSLLEKASRKIRLPLDDLIQTSLSSSSKATPNLFMNAMDLLHHLLQFNQNKRLTAGNALNHKYIQRFHNPMEDNNIGHDILNPIPDDVQLTVDEYRTRLYNIVTNIKKEKRIKLAKEPSIQRNIEENKTQQSVKNISGQLNAKHDGTGQSKQNDLAFLDSTSCKSFSNQIAYSTKNNHFTKLQTENNIIRNGKSPKHYCDIMDRQKNHINNPKTISPYSKDLRIGNSKAEPTVISSHAPCRIQAPLAWSQHIKSSTINFSQEFNNPVIMRTFVSTNKQCKTSLQGALAKTSSSNHDTTSLNNYSQSYGKINASKVVTLNRTKTSN